MTKLAEDERFNFSTADAIHSTEETLTLRPDGHPLRASCFNYLARLRLIRHLPDHVDILLALDFMQKALGDKHALPRILLRRLKLTFFILAGNFMDEIVTQPELGLAALRVSHKLVSLLPRVACLGLGLTARLRELEDCGELGAMTATLALCLSETVSAVEFLEEGRAVFWAQALQLRTPLDNIPTKFAGELKDIMRDLERKAQIPDTEIHDSLVPSTSAWNDRALADRRRQSERVESVITSIREQPGLERFLMPAPLTVLKEAAKHGPVVILLSWANRSYAVVVTKEENKPRSIHLDTLTETVINDLTSLGITRGLQTFSGTYPYDISVEERKIGKSSGQKKVVGDSKNSRVLIPEEDTSLMDQLWNHVVKHVVTALELKVRARACEHSIN